MNSNTCIIPGCKSNKGKNITLYDFPLKNYELSLDWLNAVHIDNWVPSRHTKVCSKHFKESDFEVSDTTASYSRILKANAVPSCFLPSDSNFPFNSKAKKNCSFHLPLPPGAHFCCVWGCSINSVKLTNNLFHLLPINHQLTICDCIGLSTPVDPIDFLSKSLEICDQHFKQNAMLIYINTEISAEDIKTKLIEKPNSALSIKSNNISTPTKNPTTEIEPPEDDVVLVEEDLLHFDFSLNKKQRTVSYKNTKTSSQNKENSTILRDCLTKRQEKIQNDFYDVDSICRICLHDGELIQIYGNSYGNISVKELVENCINLEDPNEINYPQKVCKHCLVTLTTVYNCMNESKRSTKILNNFITKQKDIALKSLFYDHNYDKYSLQTRINLKELMETAGINIFDTLGTDEIETTITDAEEILKDTIPPDVMHKIKDTTKLKKVNKKIPKKVLETLTEKANLNIGGKQFILAKAFTCKKCKELFFTQESFNSHLDSCTPKDDELDANSNPKNRKCKTCSKVFKNEFQQITHKCTKKNLKNSLRCSKCNVKFTCLSMFSQHTCDPEKIKLVAEARKAGRQSIRFYKCKYCDEKYITYKDLNNHKKLNHPFPLEPKPKIPKCTYCSITFNTIDELKQHRKESHGQDRIVTCPTCMKQMKASHYCNHKKIHVLERRYCCEFCGKRFKTPTCFRSHVNKVHLGIKPYACDICDRPYSTRSKMMEHRNVHSETKKYMCDLCGATFTYRSCLDSHFRKKRCGKTKGLSKGHQCPNCNETVSSRRLLIIHRREVHGVKKGVSSQKTYTCEVCKIPCESAVDLKSHETIHGSKQFICEQTHCRRPFFTAERLQRHLRVHDTVNVKCEICCKGFFSKLSLNMHMRTHTGEKNYQCEYCPKKFTQQGHLISHTRTHTGAKPYQCPFCDRAFAMSGNLTVHIRTHTGQRPYECNFCDQAFFDASSRKRHVVQKHEYRMVHSSYKIIVDMSALSNDSN